MIADDMTGGPKYTKLAKQSNLNKSPSESPPGNLPLTVGNEEENAGCYKTVER